MYYCFLLIMTLIGSVASFFLKKASDAAKFPAILTKGNFYIGLGLYLLGAVLNIFILHYLDYSVVLPLTAFTYVWTMVLSCKFLKEKMSKRKAWGVALIITGAVFVSI